MNPEIITALLNAGMIDQGTADIMQRQQDEAAARQWAETIVNEASQAGLSAQQQRLLDLVAATDGRPTAAQLAAFWTGENGLLWQALGPAITQVATERSAFAAVTAGQIDTFALVNQQVIAWVETYYVNGTDSGSVGSLNATSRAQFAEAFARWQRGEVPFSTAPGLDGLIDLLTPTFGPNRAEMIAITETTRVFVEAQRQAEANNPFTVAFRWLTSVDEAVCFPAGTMIETECGPLPIESIKPGTMVLTRKGFRSVVATNKRLHDKPMVTVRTKLGDVTATYDHPFWTSEQGWLECGKLNTDHTLETFHKRPIKISGLFNFDIGDSANAPSIGFKILDLACVPLSILMPVSSINFQGYVEFSQKEVNAISTHLGLLDIGHADIIKALPDGFFKKVFALKRAITSEAAKAPISIRRFFPDLFSAIFALNDDGWTSAFFRTIMPVQMFLCRKKLSAPFAINVLGFCSATGPATKGVTICDGGGNREFLDANRANFCYHFGGFAGVKTSAGTKFLISCDAGRRKIEILTALRTDFILAAPLAFCGAKLKSFSCDWHNLHLLISITELYHRLSTKATWVYDLQVDEVPEFYANGILVHNCPICGPLHGQVRRKQDGYAGGVDIPAHVRCRCHEVPETEATLQQPLPPEERFVYAP